MKRIGIIQIWQESNSFNPVPTTLSDFEQFGIAQGKEVLERYGAVDEIGGFLAGMREWTTPAEPVGLMRAGAWAGGPLSNDTLDYLTGTLRKNLVKTAGLDALLFSLHGALMAQDGADVDGCLLETARSVVGDDVPIVATLDLHADLTARMIRHADALVAFHTAPHVDRPDTGRRAARALERIFRGARPSSATVKLPMIAVAEAHYSAHGPLAPIFAQLARLEAQDEILSAALIMTQPWLDIPRLGWSTLVVTDGDPELGSRLANELADICWDCHEELTSEFSSPEEAVARALTCPEKPVVLADGPDGTSSGACGDGTHVLEAMIGVKIPDGALTIMVDPEAVACAREAGPGGVFEFAVGGKRDNVFSQPLPVTGKVLFLREARYVLSGCGGENLPVNSGLGAAVQIDDVTLLLIEHAGPGVSPLMYRCVGLEPKDFKIVVAKSCMGFRPSFAPFAADIIQTDAPGCSSPHFEQLPFKRIARPLWPLDEITGGRRVPWTQENENI